MDAAILQSPWEYVAQQVVVHESLDVTLRRTWHLQSEKLLLLSQNLKTHALIPLQPLNPALPSLNEVTIKSLSNRRTVTPVPYRTVADLTADDGRWPNWLAVPMYSHEYTATVPPTTKAIRATFRTRNSRVTVACAPRRVEVTPCRATGFDPTRDGVRSGSRVARKVVQISLDVPQFSFDGLQIGEGILIGRLHLV